MIDLVQLRRLGRKLAGGPVRDGVHALHEGAQPFRILENLLVARGAAAGDALPLRPAFGERPVEVLPERVQVLPYVLEHVADVARPTRHEPLFRLGRIDEPAVRSFLHELQRAERRKQASRRGFRDVGRFRHLLRSASRRGQNLEDPQLFGRQQNLSVHETQGTVPYVHI